MKAAVAIFFVLSAFFQVDAEETKKRDWSMSHATLEEIQASYDQLSQSLKSASLEGRIEVFEGLPHPKGEPDLFAAESKREDPFEDHGFLFYPMARPLTDADSSALERSLRSEKSYLRFIGPKLCGGYHPDFLIRMTDGDSKITFQICFGCHEARVFSGAQIVHCDLSEEGFAFLEAVLEDYYWMRPDKQPVEKAGADQPATATEPKPEGGDKPQHEVEDRSR